jgi:uncharacterized protein involved in response to NO
VKTDNPAMRTRSALFSLGLRPFFLLAGAWAAFAVPIWAAALLFGDGTIAGVDGRMWHIHEMLFGFLPGVMAGFLLTAVPNWTGRLPVSGAWLRALALLWLAGRAASFASGPLAGAGAVVDSLFLVVLAGAICREVLAGKNLRNLPVAGLVGVFAAANICFHLRAVHPAIGDAPQRVALSVGVMLIALIGGRIVPSFTRNWLAAHRRPVEPAPFAMFDRVALALTGIALAAWIAAPHQLVTGLALAAAGVVTLVRLWRWRGWTTAAEALVWILHAGYAALGLGLVLLGASIVWPATVPWTAGVHALTAGAVGIMTLAVMTRASLGHTGRDRVAGPATLAIYLLVIAAALTRVAAPFAGIGQALLLLTAAVLWCGAFAAFTAVYGPILVSPRFRGG